jgi:D-alanyl-D-alanine carboxypeptidase
MEWAQAALEHKFGNYIDVDGYYQGQCWDLAAHKARHVDGCPSLPTGSGGAEGVYRLFDQHTVLHKYYDRVPNNPSDPNQLPPVGALIVYGPTRTNQFGHIEVVLGANAQGVDVIYQDGFNQTEGPKRRFRPWGQLPTLGWLVPKTQAAPSLAGYQRIVAGGGVKRRLAPNTQSASPESFKGGEVLDFAGWLRGETVENNNVWFKGRYSDSYFWSGAFTDAGNHDLTDLNPVEPPKAPEIKGYQRVVIDGGLNVRSEPSTMATIIKTMPTGTVFDATGWRTGSIVEGNDVWFQLADGWAWSGGTSDPNTHDLVDRNSQAPKPAPEMPPVVPIDTRITEVVNKKKPIEPFNYTPLDLVQVGNGQTMRAEAAQALEAMKKSAENAGVPLTPASGFRSFATQQQLYGEYVRRDGQAKADTYSARPAHSEHQTGLTMDFAPIEDVFANSGQYAWLLENAHKYGFVLRYPKDFTQLTGYMFEPWHWRYIGVSVATQMHENGISTLEQYFKVPGGLYEGQTETPAEPSTPTTPGENPVPPKPGEPVEEPHPPLVNDRQTSIIRTVVPYIIGFIVAMLAKYNLNLPPELMEDLPGLVTFVVGSVYYIVVRTIEPHFPAIGILLGKAKPPVYEDKD